MSVPNIYSTGNNKKTKHSVINEVAHNSSICQWARENSLSRKTHKDCIGQCQIKQRRTLSENLLPIYTPVPLCSDPVC